MYGSQGACWISSGRSRPNRRHFVQASGNRQTSTQEPAASMAKAPTDGGSKAIRLKGHQNFRYRIMKSILTSRAIHISEIRSNFENPGIKDFEISFLRLVERLTNGTLVEISYTGTEIYLRPGLVVGGKIVHECPNSRAVGWFLEPLLVLGLFGKQPLNITLRGITSNTRDVSVSHAFRHARTELSIKSSLTDRYHYSFNTYRPTHYEQHTSLYYQPSSPQQSLNH